MNADTTTDYVPEPPEMRAIHIEIPTAVAHGLLQWHEGTLEGAAMLALKLYINMGKDTYAALRALAQSNGTSVHKALKAAILHSQEAVNAPAVPAAPGRPKINTERDNAIYAAVTYRGTTYAQAAVLFNISVVRIGQIMAHQRAVRGETTDRAPRAAKAGQPEQIANAAHTPQSETDVTVALFLEMDDGLPAARAAQKYNLPLEHVVSAYEAYREALGNEGTKGAKLSASFAGLYRLKLLTLKESDAPANVAQPEAPAVEAPVKPRFVPPVLEELRAKQAAAEPKPIVNEIDPEFGF